jgi:coenzyme F420-0:L-glutamate ligase/coenzyme F420-1:gamma-L-glutamate ligase
VLSARALDGIPEVGTGDDLPAVIAGCLSDPLSATDVLVIAHKIVSKAEGRTRRLRDVVATARAVELGEELGKDPRHVQVVLDESSEVLRASQGVLICVTHRGFVCANAGVDASNVPGEDTVLLHPRDPDASARALRAGLRERAGAAPAVVITDSFGRAWRHGQCDVAIGCAGLEPLEDWRGRIDTTGRELRATLIAVADQLASAADLARTKDGRQPAVIVRGAERYVIAADGPGAAALIRPSERDLFR